MKRSFLTMLILVMVLSVLAIPASASPPATVAGDWLYIPYIKVKDDSGDCVKPELDYTHDPYPMDIDERERCERVAGGNLFMETYEIGWWSGDFEGTSEDHGRVVFHRSGSANFKAIVYYTGVVNGKSGTLEMSVTGRFPAGATEWRGKWVILRGTDQLDTLRGQGTWWGPGWQGDPDVPGVIHYEGKVHFEP